MSQFNASSFDLDLAKINSVTNERDLKLWKGQATAKYCKRKYEEFRQENEILDHKIKKLEQKIEKNERKIPKVKALVERMVGSVILASDVTDHLIQLKIYLKDELSSCAMKYEVIKENYMNMYKQKRTSLEENNSLYKELNETTVRVEKMKLEDKILSQNILNQNKIIKQKMHINREILITDIVDFARVMINTRKLQVIDKELIEKKVEAQNLLEIYEKLTQSKGSIQSCRDIPRLSMKPMHKAEELNIPQFSFTIPLCPKQVAVPKINEINLINKLKERSAERLKIIRQRQNSQTLPIRSKESEKKGIKINTGTTISSNEDKEGKQNKLDSSQQDNFKPAPRLNILQNEVIIGNNNAIGNNVMEKQKRSSSEIVENIVKKKKVKKVSFGQYLSPEDPRHIVGKPEKVVSSIASTSEGVQDLSSYFAKKDNAKSSQQETASSQQPTGNCVLPGSYFESDESFCMGKNLKESSHDLTFFSMTRSPERNIFNDAGNDNTFFTWSQPNSQQNNSFSNAFNIF